ncbi:MAG TPA: carboxypeptidase-like regulatory domain-containing protein, partial [Bacteroidia bacterium]|nr:carboxypeptidase-like regulatory domain-containing protein [Bacteroidia bacterium]
MISKNYSFGFLLSFIVLILSASVSKAATIKGAVTDSVSKEGLIGATVYVKDNLDIHDIAGLDGSYSIKNLKQGTYTIVAKFFGYTTQEKTITVSDDTQDITADFLMSQEQFRLNNVTIVSSYNKESDNYARSIEKNSDYLLNVMSAKTIQLLADATVGDVLQRVSGVTVEKSVTGGGKYAAIRGMDKRYNYTTINGVKIPSPDYKNRYVPMDIFPSDILARLEVIKTLTPAMEGDAIGGAMNLVLKDAPDQFALTGDLATEYNQTLFNNAFNSFDARAINPNSPNEINGPDYGTKVNDFPLGAITYTPVKVVPDILAGTTIGNRFLNKKLGVLFSVSYQNTYSATQGFFIRAQAQPSPGPTFNTPDWDYNSNRYFSTQQTREAAHLKLDYSFNGKHKISLYTVYAGMNQFRSRFENDTVNSLPGSELDPSYETKVSYQNMYNATLQGTDSLLPGLCLDWTAAYSRAWANTPDWSTISLTGTVGQAATYFSSLTSRWMQNSDQDFSGYINLTYKFKLFNQTIELKTGAMNRDKARDAFYAEYNFNATPFQPPYTNINVILSNPNLYRFSDTTGSPENANTYSVQE